MPQCIDEGVAGAPVVLAKACSTASTTASTMVGCGFLLSDGERTLVLDLSLIAAQRDALAAGLALGSGAPLPSEPLQCAPIGFSFTRRTAPR